MTSRELKRIYEQGIIKADEIAGRLDELKERQKRLTATGSKTYSNERLTQLQEETRQAITETRRELERNYSTFKTAVEEMRAELERENNTIDPNSLNPAIATAVKVMRSSELLQYLADHNETEDRLTRRLIAEELKERAEKTSNREESIRLRGRANSALRAPEIDNKLIMLDNVTAWASRAMYSQDRNSYYSNFEDETVISIGAKARERLDAEAWETIEGIL